MERSIVGSSVHITEKAYNSCLPIWERLSRDWRKLDRLEMDYGQLKALAEKVVKTRYCSAYYLAHPSMGEFQVKLRLADDPGMDIRIAFRSSLLDRSDFPQEENDIRAMEPLVDAYVYMDDRGTDLSFILTLCRAEIVDDERIQDCVAEFVPWYKDDFYTRTILSGNPKVFSQFAQEILLLFLGVQMLHLEESHEPKVFVLLKGV